MVLRIGYAKCTVNLNGRLALPDWFNKCKHTHLTTRHVSYSYNPMALTNHLRRNYNQYPYQAIWDQPYFHNNTADVLTVPLRLEDFLPKHRSLQLGLCL